jgi:NADH dehydrogenase
MMDAGILHVITPDSPLVQDHCPGSCRFGYHGGVTKGLLIVFGGTGFLGRRIVRRALQEGWVPRVVARHSRAVSFDDSEHVPEQVITDIRDPEAVARAVRGAAGVVNAVGLYVQNPSERFDTTHVLGAGHVAQAAKRASARLVHFSGIGVNRRSPSAYVRSRALGEERVRDAYPESVILRPSALFGPGDALVSAMTPMIKWSPVIPLFGEGGSRIQPVHVDDAARAAVAALERADAAGNTYDLGGPDVFTYRELWQALAGRLRRRRWFVSVSLRTWKMLAAVGSLLPRPPITRDQLELVSHDNVVGAEKTFADLGIDTGSLARVVDAVEDA